MVDRADKGMKKAVCLTLLLIPLLWLRGETNRVFRCHVKVVDAQGQPISGALVEQFQIERFDALGESPPAVSRTTTDGAGTVALTSTNQGYYLLLASKPGLTLSWNGWYPGQVPDQEDAVVELALTAPKAVAGIVKDTAGRPVADTAVWVKAAFRGSPDVDISGGLLPSSLGRQRFSAQTGADGKFRIEGFAEGVKLALAIAKAGMALDQPHDATAYFNPSALEIEAGQSDLVLTLKPGGVIEGRVVKAEGGAAVAGARVTFADLGLGTGATPAAFSGPDGWFRFTELEAGDYQIQARLGTNEPPDLVGEPVSVTVEAGVTNREAKLTLSPGGLLEVTVETSAGEKSIAGAIVYATAPGAEMPMRPVTTSEQGIARFRLAPGDYQVFASKGQNSGQGGQVTVELNQTNHATVSMAAPEVGAPLRGTVVDSTGKPAPKATVLLFPFHRAESKTDAQGRFELALNPRSTGGMANYQTVLIARDLDRNLAAAVDVEEDTTNMDLRLEPGLTLAGRVADPDEKPVTNAQVTVMFWTERMGSSFGTPVKVDAKGAFEIKGLPPGRRYGVSASATGFGQDHKTLEAADTATNRVELPILQLPLANLRLAGVVLDAEDKPIAGANINSYGSQQPQLNSRTDAKGHFAFEHVCAGPINLSANSPRGGQNGNVSAEGGDTNVTIHLGSQEGNLAAANSRARPRINGSVLDADGKPAAKVSVCLFPFFSYAQKKTDDAGRFVLTPDSSAAGIESQRVIIARDPERNLGAALDLDEDATNVTLKLTPGFTLAGQATDTAGKPLANAQAQLLFRTDRMSSPLGQSVRANDEGKFEIRGLPAGRRFSVTVSAKGYGQESHEAETAEGQNPRLELDTFQLLVADQHIAGFVLDSDDKPVRGAWLYCYGEKQTGQSGQSDAKGHFSFDKVCAGNLQISANSQNGGFASAQAEAGDTNITIRLNNNGVRRSLAPRPVSLRGKPLPDLTPAGLTAADCPPGAPVLAVLIDAEQRPCRRVLRLLGDQASVLKQKGVAVVVLQSGDMADDAFAAWKQEAATPFPIGQLKQEPDKARAAWGAGALPWFILTDQAHRVIAEGFGVDDLEVRLGDLK